MELLNINDVPEWARKATLKIIRLKREKSRDASFLESELIEEIFDSERAIRDIPDWQYSIVYESIRSSIHRLLDRDVLDIEEFVLVIGRKLDDFDEVEFMSGGYDEEEDQKSD